MSSNPLSGFLEELPISQIRPSKKALRADLGSLDELMASIEEKGLLEPIVVRPVENGFEVVAGNRRFEACKRLGLRKIPCHVVELNDKEAFEVSLVENIQRRSLNPIEEAEAFKKYVDEYGYGGISELARRIGKSQEYVSRRIQLLTLPQKIKEEVMHWRITTSIAQELLPLKDDIISEKIAEIAVEKQLPMREVRKIVRYHREKHSLDGLQESLSDVQYMYSSFEKRMNKIDRVLDRCIASLKMSLYRLSDAINEIEDEWVLRELLWYYRDSINDQINSLLRLKKKIIH